MILPPNCQNNFFATLVFYIENYLYLLVLNKNYKQSKYYNYEKNVFDFGDGGKCYDVIV